jgi:small-conductance mechanosensitive channel
MKALCDVLGVVCHLGSIVFVWWFGGWLVVAVFCALNLSAGFFYAVSKRIK